MAEQIDSRVELIQALIPFGLDAVNDLLQKEVKALAGERYRRGGRPAGFPTLHPGLGPQAQGVHGAEAPCSTSRRVLEK